MSPRRLFPAFLTALALALGLPGPAVAQTVELRGRGDLRTDTMLKRILAGGDYRLFTADTVLAAADTLDGDVLVIGATVKFENLVRGDLTLVDANVFLRPGARVTGRVLNIGGGLFPAPTASIEGEVLELRDAPYQAEIRSDGVSIRGTRTPSLVDPEGLRGLLPPTFDRVNGLGLHGGARLLLPRFGSTEPELVARADYHAARERGGGALELGLRTLSGWHARVGAERVVANNDEWIRGDVVNSLVFGLLGHDMRNYYDAERAFAAVGAEFAHEGGSSSFTLRGQLEDALPLTARNPWHAWGDDPARPNPEVDAGRIASLVALADAQWSRPTFVASIAGSLERATEIANGDFTFTAFEVSGAWSMRALANHTYLLSARFRGPFAGSASLPRQRWSGLGGGGTLPTLDDFERTGDRLVFISSTYSIPIPGIDLPALGSPAVELLHRFGSAWSLPEQDEPSTGSRVLTQNLGLRLRFRLAWIRGVFDPEDPGSLKFSAGIARAPRFPWTRREDR